jgi:hypothetical protein
MKKIWCVAAWMVLVGCQEDDVLEPPMIEAVPASINLGTWPIGAEQPVQFDVQIRNIGEQRLELEGAMLRHDQNCSFQFMGPDLDKVIRKQAAFIRVWYTPQVRGADRVALHVKSNSVENEILEIPICARGELPEEMTDGGVGGASSGGCEAPPKDQPDCAQK